MTSYHQLNTNISYPLNTKEMIQNFTLRIALFLLAFVLFCPSGKGQIPAPFPDSTASWSVEFYETPDPWLPYNYYYYRYFLDGDTLINGQTYTRLFEAQTNAALIDTSAAIFIGGIREDSTQKVFFTGPGPSYYPIYCTFPATNNQEVLLYDFGRSVGDTFYIPVSGGNTWLNEVLDIDTISYGGVMRRRFEIRQNGEQVFQIEGIGSDKGIFYPYCTYFEWDWTLLCFSDPSISWNPMNNNCYLITGLEERVALPKVTITPHPVGPATRLTVESENFSPFELEIYNLQGKVLHRQELWTGDALMLKKLDLSAGTYMYRLGSLKDGTVTGKLIVL